jgi:hypothetical protein
MASPGSGSLPGNRPQRDCGIEWINRAVAGLRSLARERILDRGRSWRARRSAIRPVDEERKGRPSRFLRVRVIGMISNWGNTRDRYLVTQSIK